VKEIRPLVLEGHGIRLEPLTVDHAPALAAAAGDGRLWELWYIAVPPPEGMPAYVATALEGLRDAHMLPWVVRDVASDTIIGSTRYHDILPAMDRVEIGYTWYGQSRQRTHVNTTCKLLLLSHAFDTLGCQVVGLRTDKLQFSLATRHRSAGSEPRRRDPPLRCASRRQHPRYRHVQHSRR